MFFLQAFFKKVDPDMSMDSALLAKKMWSYFMRHVDRRNGESLYRIFYYDCPPLETIVHHPLTNQQINYAKSDITKYMNSLHKALVRQPYLACRMGSLRVDSKTDWGFNRINRVHNFKNIIRGQVDVADIDPKNVVLKPKQNGVDMKLGIDITSVVLKDLAKKIILISGDSDFVPAAKLARTEGAHFILDAMGMKVTGELAEHIDGLRTFITRPEYNPRNNEED